jgi:hypothetical protein
MLAQKTFVSFTNCKFVEAVGAQENFDAINVASI